VLHAAILEGRRTFANVMKYIMMATSSNFGNMFSMAGASVFLPFLPLLPKQILLNNLLTDFPEMTIATDSVDSEMVLRPRRWNIGFIRTYMFVFGILSSVFDYLTFGALLFILNASMEQFRTGWFMESVISASLVVLVIRSQKPFFKSKTGKYLITATLLVVAATLLFPFTLPGKVVGFSALPLPFFTMLGAIVALYIVAAEITKKVFYMRVKF